MKLLILLAIVFYACSTGKCYPSRNSKDWAEVKKVKSGYLVTTHKYFKTEKKIFECLPSEYSHLKIK